MSRSFGATSLTMRSPMKISPLVCSSRPASIRRAVVFPQPDGPTSTRNSASRTARLRSLTATTSPKRFVTWSYVTVAIESKSMSWDFAAEARVRTRVARRDREEIALDPPRAARRDAHDEGLAVALEEAARRRAVETWLVVGRGRHAKEHERQRGGDREERSRHARTVRDRGARVCPHFVPSRRHFVRRLSSFFARTSRGGLGALNLRRDPRARCRSRTAGGARS